MFIFALALSLIPICIFELSQPADNYEDDDDEEYTHNNELSPDDGDEDEDWRSKRNEYSD